MAGSGSTRLFTAEIVKLAGIGLFDAVEAGLAEVRKYAARRLATTRRLILLRSVAYALAFLAVVWFCVGATVALMNYIPMWAAFMAVSGVLALGSCVMFIARPERADPKGNSLADDTEDETEKENENGS